MGLRLVPGAHGPPPFGPRRPGRRTLKETFDAAWLALREPADHRSRAEGVLPPLTTRWRARRWSRVLDLGSGTGSNLRWLAPRLPGPQAWTLLDHDAGLLARAVAPTADAPGGLTVEPKVGDLAREGLAEVPRAHLVTASALLDLVGEAWLEGLVDACRRAEAGALFALTWDGTVAWAAAAGGDGRDDALDALVLEAVRAHQGRDKGLGPALGPTAAHRAERLFAGAGYWTRLLPSPWRLGAGDAALVRALVNGWEAATLEQRPELAERAVGWGERRAAAVARGDVTLTLGHLDLLALP